MVGFGKLGVELVVVFGLFSLCEGEREERGGTPAGGRLPLGVVLLCGGRKEEEEEVPAGGRLPLGAVEEEAVGSVSLGSVICRCCLSCRLKCWSSSSSSQVSSKVVVVGRFSSGTLFKSRVPEGPKLGSGGHCGGKEKNSASSQL